jgi:hypothetical protein
VGLKMRITLKKHPALAGVWVSKDSRVFVESFPQYPKNLATGYVLVAVPGGRFSRATIVAEAWLGARPKSKNGERIVVRHKNGVSTNDWAWNLLWGTQRQNCEDTIRHGRSTRGTKNARAKINEKVVHEIRGRRKLGEALKSIAEDFGISQQSVCDIMAGRTWGWLKKGKGR